MRKINGRAGMLLLVVLLFAAMLPQLCFADVVVEKNYDNVYDADFYVKVNASDGGANLRTGPSTDDEILVSMMPNGTVIHIEQVCKKSNGKNWGFGEYDGKWGWVSLTQCEETDIHKVTTPETTPTYVAELVEPDVAVSYDVNVNAPDGGVNLRYGPGKDYQQVIPQMIGNGTKLHIRGEKKAANGKLWGLAEFDGDFGWVFLEQCDRLEDTSATPDTEENDGIALADDKDDTNAPAADSSAGMIPITTAMMMIVIVLLLIIVILGIVIATRRRK